MAADLRPSGRAIDNAGALTLIASARPGAKVRKFLPQNPRRVNFDLAHELARRPPGVGLDEGVNVIRHHFEGMHCHSPPFGGVRDQFNAAFGTWGTKPGDI